MYAVTIYSAAGPLKEVSVICILLFPTSPKPLCWGKPPSSHPSRVGGRYKPIWCHQEKCFLSSTKEPLAFIAFCCWCLLRSGFQRDAGGVPVMSMLIFCVAWYYTLLDGGRLRWFSQTGPPSGLLGSCGDGSLQGLQLSLYPKQTLPCSSLELVIEV